MAGVIGIAAWLVAGVGGEARAGRLFLAMGDDGGGGINVNLIVRQVTVTPIHAHVGDPIRVEVVIENAGEGHGTITPRIYANGEPVASRLFTYDPMDGPSALYRESFVWVTTGAHAGDYWIRAEAFDWSDASPFDNELEVAEPVTLVAAGAPFPPGMQGGGEAVAVDRRWRPSGAEGQRNAPERPGIVR